MARVMLVLVAYAFVVTPLVASEVARVGDLSITGQDVTYRVATEHAFGATTVDGTAALVSLVNDAIESELAERHGVGATMQEVAALGQHADATSKAPDVLARVKAAFGADRAAYERLYLAPKVTTGKLRDWFVGNADVQAAARATVEAVRAGVLQGQSMQEAAQAQGLSVETVEPTSAAESGPVPSGSALEAAVASLQAGQLAQLLEDDEAFRVVRLVERTPAGARLEVVTVAKVRFESWVQEQAAGLGWQMEPGVASEVRAKMPGLWWLGLLGS